MAEVSAAAAAAAADDLYIPLDIVSEIVSRVPVKKVLEWKLVSRDWRMLLSERHFISIHLRRSPAALLVYARKALVPVANRVSSPNGHTMYLHRPANPQLGDLPVTERIEVFPGSDAVRFIPMAVVGAAPTGIVCISQGLFAERFTVWNPATRATLQIPGPVITVPITIPQSSVSWTSTGFAFDRSLDEYAIIHIVQVIQIGLSSIEIAHVFSFRTGRWDLLGSFNFQTLTTECEAIVKGIPYWRASVEGVKRLMWFELGTSRFCVQDFVLAMLSHARMCLGQIREDSLGAIVWSPIEPLRYIHIWTRSEDGLWSEIYSLTDVFPVGGVSDTFVGFYVDGMIADQSVSFAHEEDVNPTLPTLVKMTSSFTHWEEFCYLEDAWIGTCKLVKYKESLVELPKIPIA